MHLCSFSGSEWDGGAYGGGIKCGPIVEKNPGGSTKRSKEKSGLAHGRRGNHVWQQATCIAAHAWFAAAPPVQPSQQPAAAQRSLSADACCEGGAGWAAAAIIYASAKRGAVGALVGGCTSMSGVSLHLQQHPSQKQQGMQS